MGTCAIDHLELELPSRFTLVPQLVRRGRWGAVIRYTASEASSDRHRLTAGRQSISKLAR